jgi:hypothetical protein
MIHEIKLLKIHKRRLDILKQQKAKTGAHYNATLEMEIGDIEEAMKEIEDTLGRRLQSLRLKVATYGLSADPSISIEIEDIESYFETIVDTNTSQQCI